MIKKLFIIILAFLLIPTTLALNFTGTLNISCQREPNFNINEKEYCLAEIPINYSNQSFKCISYVELNNETLQTNPEYKERSQTFLSFLGSEQELREYFEPANLVVNFYYTRKNLYPNNKYHVGITCNSPTASLNGEQSVVIDYENLDFLFARTEWAKRNVHYIVAFIILMIIIVAFLLWVFQIIK
jgi:hypothetical protein